jgi:hypothetical protein
MVYQDYHTNIMLDLECCDALVPDPVIIEMAATHFNLDTGETLGTFSTPVNYESCINLGLKTSKEGLVWLDANIPSTLKASKATPITISHALFKFNKFLRDSVQLNADKRMANGLRSDSSQLMIWGNGAVADNVWIASAYRACGMEKPWKFYNDSCVRTIVKQCAYMTGKDFARGEVFKGKKHVALDDCFHQVSYLVKARNHLMPARTPRKRKYILPSPETSFSFPNDDIEAQAEKDAEPAFTGPLHRGMGLMSPETSFSVPNATQEERKAIPISSLTKGQPLKRNGLATPATSFSVANETQEKRKAIPISSLTKGQPLKRNGITTPATSFSAPPPEDDELEVIQPNDDPDIPSARKNGLLSPETSFNATEEENSSAFAPTQTTTFKFEDVISGSLTPAVMSIPVKPITPKPRRKFFRR